MVGCYGDVTGLCHLSNSKMGLARRVAQPVQPVGSGCCQWQPLSSARCNESVDRSGQQYCHDNNTV